MLFPLIFFVLLGSPARLDEEAYLVYAHNRFDFRARGLAIDKDANRSQGDWHQLLISLRRRLQSPIQRVKEESRHEFAVCPVADFCAKQEREPTKSFRGVDEIIEQGPQEFVV